MSNPFTTRMVGCTLTHQIWKRLEDHFASQIKAKVMQLKNKLSTIQIGTSVTEYVLSIKSTIDALASVGEPIKESDHVNAILHGLTEEYGNVMTSVLAISTSITVGELEALLLAHESMLARFRKSETLMQVNIAQHSQYTQAQSYSQNFGGRENFRGNSRGRTGRMSRGGRRTMQGDGRPQCQVCDKIGHTAKFCWYRYDKEQYEDTYNNNNQITQPKTNYSNVITTPSTVQDPNWYPDSGATHHVTHDVQNLVEKAEYTGNEQVVIGDGSGLHIHHVGKMCFNTDLSSKLLLLTKLLHESKELLLQGSVDRGLYKFGDITTAHTPSVYISSLTQSNKFLIWHARLGHANPSVVSKIFGDLHPCQIAVKTGTL
ncbi:uncharacterized protein LOC110267213 [Arachis ipaensis]|uniref:uncharacterized protein LOC110267213 n=1 Tax=Arachis ipaensis TaxID=130454 RepID=UPI000A2B7C2C|nr:uncharacterized protein LOC110267213 [Arachis ipaensis]